jgi:hypothetical protein
MTIMLENRRKLDVYQLDRNRLLNDWTWNDGWRVLYLGDGRDDLN